MKSLLHLILFSLMVYVLVLASVKLKKFGLGFFILGLYMLWKAFNNFVFPKLFDYEKFKDYEVLKTDGFVCKMKSKDGKITKSGCMYKDAGCISPVPEGGCPSTFDEYKTKLNIKNDKCDHSVLFRKLKKLDDTLLNLYLNGKGELQLEYPVEDCLTGIDEANDKADILKIHYKEYLDSQKTNSPNTEVSKFKEAITTEHSSIANELMKGVYREVYKTFFSNSVDNSVAKLEESRLNSIRRPGVTPIPKTNVPSGSFVPEKNGYVIVARDKQKPEIYDLKEAAKMKNGEIIKTKGLAKKRRLELINKCNKYICNRNTEHVQAYEEIGEKVDDLNWWKNSSSNR